MRKLKTTLIVVPALILAMVGVLLTWKLLQPAPGPPNVSVTLLGYTNDSTGARLARFAVSNRSVSAVRTAQCQIQIPAATGWTSQPDGFFSGRRVLGAGASETLAVPWPTNQSSWRISMLAYTDAGHIAVSKWEMAAALLRGVLRPTEGVMRYEIDSDRIDGQR